MYRRQVSVDNQGPFSSFGSIIDGNRVNLIFNDNLANYQESGEYVVESKDATRFGAKKNVVGLVEINLEIGAVDSRIMILRKDTGAVAPPKKFTNVLMTNDMILPLYIRDQEKFGLLKLN